MKRLFLYNFIFITTWAFALDQHGAHARLLIDRNYFSPDKVIKDYSHGMSASERLLVEQDYKKAIVRFNTLPVERKETIIQYALLNHIRDNLPVDRPLDLVGRLTGHTEGVSSTAWHPTKPATLASGGGDGTVRIWNTDDGSQVKQLSHTDWVSSAAWHPTQSATLASGGGDGTIRIWNTDDGSQVKRLSGHTDYWVRLIAWHPTQPATLASGSSDGTVRIWNTDDGSQVKQLSHTDWVSSAAWHPTQSATLASGSGDGTIRIWNTDDGSQVKRLTGHTDWVRLIAWHPTQPATLASGGSDETVRIWNTDDGSQVKQLSHTGWVSAAAWHPTKPATLASGSGDGTIRIWNTDDGSQVRQLRWHTGSVSSVAWRPTQSVTLASGSSHGTIRIGVDSKAVLESYFSSNRAMYEQKLMALLLFLRHIPDEPTYVLDAVCEMNRGLKAEYKHHKVRKKGRIYTTLDEWRQAQKAFPREVMTALNRILDLRARPPQRCSKFRAP